MINYKEKIINTQ